MSKRKVALTSAGIIVKKIERAKKLEQIFLPPSEYAKVMSEFNTHLSEKDRDRYIITKPIGDFYYTILNRGYNDYIIIDKVLINEEGQSDWEKNL